MELDAIPSNESPPAFLPGRTISVIEVDEFVLDVIATVLFVRASKCGVRITIDGNTPFDHLDTATMAFGTEFRLGNVCTKSDTRFLDSNKLLDKG